MYITGPSREPLLSNRSKVLPSYKTRYRITNSPEYDRALVRRGDLTIWFTPSAIRSWTPLPTRLRGGQLKVSDPCVELALTLKLLFGLPWRSVEGLLGSLFHFVGLEGPIPDHTTLSRRTRGLNVPLRRPSNGEPVHLVVDASGLGIVGQGQWAAAKWGERGRRGWRKLHVAVGEDGGILAVELTDASVADATALPGLLDEVPNRVKRLTADGGYDRREVYQAGPSGQLRLEGDFSTCFGGWRVANWLYGVPARVEYGGGWSSEKVR